MGVGSLWRERVADADADAGPTRWTCVGWIIESRRREEPGRGQAGGRGGAERSEPMALDTGRVR